MLAGSDETDSLQRFGITLVIGRYVGMHRFVRTKIEWQRTWGPFLTAAGSKSAT
jgi:hypothetical protein